MLLFFVPKAGRVRDIIFVFNFIDRVLVRTVLLNKHYIKKTIKKKRLITQTQYYILLIFLKATVKNVNNAWQYPFLNCHTQD